MLKSYLILICLSVSFSGFAQHYQLDSVVHHINGVQVIATQKYDAENEKAELIRYKRQGANDIIQRSERIQVAYDDKGNELYRISSVWNPIRDTWDEEEKVEQEFNANNKVIQFSSYQKRNNQWIKVFENKRLYTQDSIIETDYDTKDDKFQPIQKSVSVINAFDKIKRHEAFLWNDKEQTWQPLTQTVNGYQKDTIIIGFETIEWKQNQWHKQEKVVYELGKDSIRTENYILYKGQNNSWMPVSKFEEELWPEQNKKKSSSYKWEDINSKWMIQTQVETYFNKQGKAQDILFSEVDTTNNQLMLQLEQIHLYDKEGRLTLFQDLSHSYDARTGTQSTVKFDKEGNVIQESAYDFDPENDTWNEKMTTEFVYDKSIDVYTAPATRKRHDLFDLNPYGYITNKSAVKQVKIYLYDQEKKVLSEEFEFFYSSLP
ncbi:hypothetical protein [Sphingobacterium tabacisoli]|uniref:YD repeat-containing protein n=1 Tax=Sphingobacterium tabacisoli TaxID=2044855 RepID=A0ABW5L833_9SPHI|nr:hypothetical protein [Sphingobacterium tabacisoli]